MPALRRGGVAGWMMKDGKWKMVDGKWLMVDGKCPSSPPINRGKLLGMT